MEWVVTQQLHSKKILDKKLNEINANQRLSEARLDRQLRELGLDLTKIKRSSADLDDLHDLTPRPSARRGSLPQLAGDNTSLKPFDASPNSPRSRRRLSISSIPVTPRSGHQTGNNVNVTDNPKGTRRGSIPNVNTPLSDQTQTIKSNRNTNGALGGRKNQTSQENNELTNSLASIKQTLPKIEIELTKEDEISPVKRKNGTAHFVHQEDGVANIDAEISEAESHHLMVATKGRVRRSSEPAISVQLLHPGQLNGSDAGTHKTGDKGEFKQTLQQHLPSNMVAEEDEETGDRGGNGSGETAKSPKADTGTKNKTVQNAGKTMKKKTSIAGEKDQLNPKAGNAKTAGSPGQGHSRQRRKSEGDILRFAQIWTRQQEDFRNGRVKSYGAKNGYSSGVRDSSDDIWDSVRKCRYIRGYDPPEMRQPPDPNEYVFGHK